MSKTKSSFALLKNARTFRLKKSDTDTVIEQYFSDVDSPRSLTCWLLYKYKEHDQLVALTVDPLNYNVADKFFSDYISTEYLSKADFLKLSVDRKVAALSKFKSAEDTCRSTNQFLTDLLAGRLCVSRLDEALIKKARRKIARILGDVDGEELFNASGWGPGVTTKLSGSHVSAYNKFHLEDEITTQLYPLLHKMFPVAYPTWSRDLVIRNGERLFNQVGGNRVITVPKNAKTDRVIAVEPGLNLWLQKGIGTLIRRRLKWNGINLNSQGRNQFLARKGSQDASLATIDFSSASDTISRDLVRLLLPQRWFILMDEARCHSGDLDGQEISWEKFSSMGNGFTFELESLIFYSLSLAVCEQLKVSNEHVSVYGDDVIIPTPCVPLYRQICELLGFSLNMKKSFSSSYFRESCGSHWFDGVCVKPIYLKSRLSTISCLFILANKIRRLSHRSTGGLACDSRFLPSWRVTYLLAPRQLRSLRISEGYGDVGFIGNFDESTPSRNRSQIEGFNCLALRDKALTAFADGTALLLRGLWYGTDLERGNSYDQRGRTVKQIFRLTVPQWYYLGPWA